MLTKEQAITEDAFHYTGNGPCWSKIGPRGGYSEHCIRVRRNGATQTWKTRPTEWRIPCKYGMAPYGIQVWHQDAASYHAAKDCPAGLM